MATLSRVGAVFASVFMSVLENEVKCCPSVSSALVLTFHSCTLSWLVLKRIYVTNIDASQSFDAADIRSHCLNLPHDDLTHAASMT